MTMKVAYCTIGCANYLSRIEVLEGSLKRYNPDAEFHILLCEHPDICKDISRRTGRSFYSPQDIGCDDWFQMAFYYDIIEYNTALKPFFIDRLIQEGFESVFYFDPDIEIFSSLESMEKLIPMFDLVLTPHICHPLPDDNKTPRVEDIIRAGQFNLGYIGITSSIDAKRLLKWWQGVCIDRCLFYHDHRYFVDQFWADIFPSFVEKTYILRDPAYNMAYWNISQRELKYKEGKWITDSGELKFFHFSGLAKNDLTQISVYQNRATAPQGSELYTLLLQYFEKLNKTKWSMFDNNPYSFARYSNGEPIPHADRKLLRLMNPVERREISNPFENQNLFKSIFKINLSSPTSVISLRWRLFIYLKLFFIKYFSENDLLNQYINTSRSSGFLRANKYALRFIIRKCKGGNAEK